MNRLKQPEATVQPGVPRAGMPGGLQGIAVRERWFIAIIVLQYLH